MKDIRIEILFICPFKLRSLARIKDDNFGEWCWINQIVTLQQRFHLWSPFLDLTNILFFLCQNTEDTQRISFSLPKSISSWALAISYDIILICSIDDIMLTVQENLLVCWVCWSTCTPKNTGVWHLSRFFGIQESWAWEIDIFTNELLNSSTFNRTV